MSSKNTIKTTVAVNMLRRDYFTLPDTVRRIYRGRPQVLATVDRKQQFVKVNMLD